MYGRTRVIKIQVLQVLQVGCKRLTGLTGRPVAYRSVFGAYTPPVRPVRAVKNRPVNLQVFFTGLTGGV